MTCLAYQGRHMLPKKLTIAPLFLLLSLAACGEIKPVNGSVTDASPSDLDAFTVDATPPGPCEGDSIKLEDFQSCTTPVLCELLVECIGLAPTVAACIELTEGSAAMNIMTDIEAVEAGKTIYDGDAAATCLAALGEATCSEDLDAICDEVFVGTVADGGSCYSKNECSGVKAECRTTGCTMQCCLGSCLDTALVDGNCAVRGCPGDTECVFQDGNTPEKQCRSSVLNAPCLDDGGCGAGLRCSPGNTCQPDLTENSSCDRNTECLSPLTCVGENQNPSDGTCRPVDTLNEICDGYCRGDLYCNNDAGGLGTCQATLGMDATCTGVQECQSHLRCTLIGPDRTCQPYPTLSMSCESYTCAPGLFCTSELSGGTTGVGICAEPVINGEACARNDHCSSRICNAGFCEAYLSCYP